MESVLCRDVLHSVVQIGLTGEVKGNVEMMILHRFPTETYAKCVGISEWIKTSSPFVPVVSCVLRNDGAEVLRGHREQTQVLRMNPICSVSVYSHGGSVSVYSHGGVCGLSFRTHAVQMQNTWAVKPFSGFSALCGLFVRFLQVTVGMMSVWFRKLIVVLEWKERWV